MVYAEFGGQTECIMGNRKIENTFYHVLHLKIFKFCLVPRPHYFARPKCFGLSGPSEHVRGTGKMPYGDYATSSLRVNLTLIFSCIEHH